MILYNILKYIVYLFNVTQNAPVGISAASPLFLQFSVFNIKSIFNVTKINVTFTTGNNIKKLLKIQLTTIKRSTEMLHCTPKCSPHMQQQWYQRLQTTYKYIRKFVVKAPVLCMTRSRLSLMRMFFTKLSTITYWLANIHILYSCKYNWQYLIFVKTHGITGTEMFFLNKIHAQT